ncbi:heparan-alpha-glucosaminide N-acetyltransferase [Daktulosphaira vitifoliae]|uniref:heparan-alpha-glucosaminide N-acetyltransferase n=1 Tax=Daktulosphaira vitifoliae TaxID=58002 RepID=UPI0021A9FC1A|nr:heparan-alpha-glucosaminide N-acetyltransferase [Daktulosphaira vitifoliae]XP_050531799.1 heparan-alpha-glucosaminide N-acetyltransferase [Daktulosphaira vitifoliae]
MASDDCKTLNYDQACLQIWATNTSNTSLWMQSEECYNCDLLKVTNITNYKVTTIRLKTIYRLLLHLTNDQNNENCSTLYNFEEHGIYRWNITNSSYCSKIEALSLSHDFYMPFVFALLLIIPSFSIWFFITYIQKTNVVPSVFRFSSKTDLDIENDFGTGSNEPVIIQPHIPTPVKNTSSRITSLDAFRGISITLMIFFNMGGGRYWFFQHTPWNGIRIADFIFPWFCWVMGVSIAISLRSQLRSSTKRKYVFGRIFRRSFVLLIMGLILNSVHHNNLNTFRPLGILQRLAIIYFVASSLETIFMKPQPYFTNTKFDIIRDVIESAPQWFIIILLVGVHTAVTFLLKVPGCPKGYLGPGGLYNHSKNYNCTGGAAGYIDRMILGENHMFYGYANEIYQSKPFENEGILSTLTNVLLVYLGVHAGRIILCYQYTNERIKRWTIWTIVLGFASGLLCNFSKENGLIPINKSMFSLSYTFIAGSSAFFVFILLFLIIEHWRLWNGSPFCEIGQNSILLYIGHEIFYDTLPWSWEPVNETTHTEYLLMHSWATIFWCAIALVMHKKNIFIVV